MKWKSLEIMNLLVIIIIFLHRNKDITIIKNEIKFTVKLLGATVFKIEGSMEKKNIIKKI